MPTPTIPFSAFPTVIDNSMRESWRRCPNLFFRKYIQGWGSKHPSVHLHAGIAYASGLEHMRRAYYDDNLPSDVATVRGIRALLESYGDFDPGANQKTALNMCSALLYYTDAYPLALDYITPYKPSPTAKSAVEFTFAIALPIKHPTTGEPIIYAGRFDFLGLMKDELYVYDDKTATQLGESWANNFLLSSQMTGYVWAAQQFGYDVSKFMIRGVSITTVGNHSTQEYMGFRAKWMIDRWYSQLLQEIEQMITSWESSTWHYNQSSGCSSYGGCELLDVCVSFFPDRWLESNFTIRSYSPLTVLED